MFNSTAGNEATILSFVSDVNLQLAEAIQLSISLVCSLAIFARLYGLGGIIKWCRNRREFYRERAAVRARAKREELISSLFAGLDRDQLRGLVASSRAASTSSSAIDAGDEESSDLEAATESALADLKIAHKKTSRRV